jgi:hypothetical protein
VTSFDRCYLGRGQAQERQRFLPRPWLSLSRDMHLYTKGLVHLSEWLPTGFTGSCCRASWPKLCSSEAEFSPDDEADFGRGGVSSRG